MNSSSKVSSKSRKGDTWYWRRWIKAAHQDEWIERLRERGFDSCALTEKPDRVRILISVCVPTQARARRLVDNLGGEMEWLRQEQWLPSKPSPPLRIGGRLQIFQEKPRARQDKSIARLHIPHGLAFGSGEHATTSMLLRSLMQERDLRSRTVLDLGTGSGVLALAARLLGAQRIVATDWDAEAIRTARENELLNFTDSSIRWARADVKGLKAKTRYHLVLANLFSGILCAAAGSIAATVLSEGRLWLSGILRTQQDEVIAAYRQQGLIFLRSVRRGKWVMLQWQQPSLREA